MNSTIEIIENWPNGNVRRIYTAIDQKEYTKCGEYREWYPDGQIRIQTSYLNGKLHGEYRKWYNTKKLNVCYKVTSGWEDGNQLAMKASFINGNLEGDCRKWNLNCQATTWNVYENGKLIK